MKIGVFGGAFNPVHKGHIHLADAYYEALMLDKIIFIPTAKPPHKPDLNLAPSEDRINMLKLAIADKPYEISTIELDRQGVSYSVDTLSALKEIYPNDELYLIIGADQFFYFDKWYKYDEILKLVTICTLARENEEEKLKLLDFSEKLGIENSFYLLNAPVFKASSTQIRNGIKAGDDVSALLPNGVMQYIIEKGLYSV